MDHKEQYHEWMVPIHEVQLDTMSDKKERWQCVYDTTTCTFRGRDESDMRRHIDAVHLDIREFPCLFCAKRFRTASKQKAHMTHVHPSDQPQTYDCPHCEQTYKHSDNLTAHIQAKHIDTPMPCACPHCASTFARARDLKRHIRSVHAVQANFECLECHRRFRRRDQLIVHQQSNGNACLKYYLEQQKALHTTVS